MRGVAIQNSVHLHILKSSCLLPSYAGKFKNQTGFLYQYLSHFMLCWLKRQRNPSTNQGFFQCGQGIVCTMPTLDIISTIKRNKKMTLTTLRFPIDLDVYKSLKLDPTNSTLTNEQREILKANIQLCRDTIVFFYRCSSSQRCGRSYRRSL